MTASRDQAKALTTPRVRATRFAQLDPGELFIFTRGRERYVALAVRNTAQDEMVVLPLGPTLPEFMTWPTLMNDPGTTVVSFGRDFTLSLPLRPDAWADDEPPRDITAVVLNDAGGAFLRGNFSIHPGDFKACYVELGTGDILVNQPGHAAQFVRPKGIRAYATEWKLITTEDPPRVILSYPFS